MNPGALIATPLLILATAFFVVAEFAAVRVRSTQLEGLLDEDPRAAGALEVHRNLDRHLSSIQVAITLLTISLGAVGEDVFVKAFRHLFGLTPWPRAGWIAGTVLGIVLITLLQVVLAELLPRGVAIRNAQAWALRTAGPLLMWSRAIYPVTRLLTGLTHGLERALHMPAEPEESAPTEEELRRMLSRSGMKISRKELIGNLFDFSRRTVKEVAVPRTQVACFDVQRSLGENLALARTCPNTRLPLVDGDLDHVLGVIHLRDLLWALNERGEDLDLRSVARPAFLVPEMRLIQDLLLDFQKRQQHLALVVNEHGGVDGLVTLEDVLEELVGEIQDEFDREVVNLRRTRSGAWLAQGNVALEELEDHLGLRLEAEAGSVSLGGFFQERLGRILRAGDELRTAGWRIRVLEMRGMAPRKFLLKPLPEEDHAGDD
ncbi:hemolysin family protein [Mesoterricola sediminis]|uniref:Membrane protein n=1 Tax=Mesoterricola sediminis TaxID=2927980 RepID=A0AA48HI01_9BACT|nr:hemolysin family protein [Mesoterricola sediminis]BDU78573.1 membrane protein [Mesoterricola sediminis]